jgi:hypothetical protein
VNKNWQYGTVSKFVRSLHLNQHDVALATLLFVISVLFNVTGLAWGLPNPVRSQFYPNEVKWYEVPQNSNRLYQTAPYESYHPDEGALLNALSNMNPTALDFNPHYFNYPSLSIYLTGAMIKIADMLGYVSVENSKSFYIAHSDQMARVYLVGRLLAGVMSAFGVALLYFTAKIMFDIPIGLFSALSLALMPLWVRDSHFMLVNIPSAVWMIAAGLFAAISIKQNSLLALLTSALLAGLAASTKYPAGLVITLTFLAFMKHKTKPFPLITALVILSIFGFLLGTPYALLAPGEFLQDVLFEGASKLGVPSLRLVLSQFIVAQGTWLTALMLLGLFVVVRKLGMWQYQFVALWAVTGLIQRLISDANLVRYLIPALPPLAISSGIAINTIRQFLTSLDTPQASKFGFVVSLILLPTIGYSLNIITLMRGNDIRNNVASWLATNVRSDQVVGILGNMYYDMPPINVEKYQIINLEGLGANSQPPVIVFSSENRDKWQIQPPSYSSRIFTQRPLLVWTWPVRKWPHDWAYTFLDIYIYYQNHMSDYE